MVAYRLWHQLTMTLEAFLAQPLSAPFHVDLFNNFVRDFEGKLNQLKLVELSVRVSKQIDGACTRGARASHVESHIRVLMHVAACWNMI